MIENERPIIVKKIKRGHEAHHGGSWKVAYADFVTAMMAFFLVMWILGLSQDQRKAIAAYFNDPTGMMRSLGGGTHPLSANRPSTSGKPAILPTASGISRAQEMERFRQVKERMEKQLASSADLKALKDNIDISITTDGLRIELLDGPEPVFFESGSATCKPRTLALLRLISREVGKLPNAVAVEGHTDARPYSGGVGGYSNWELSADRANSARKAMVNGLHHEQVTEVRGYADRNLRRPDDPLHFSNRRVSILVRSAVAEQNPESKSPGGVLGIDLRNGKGL